MLKNILYSIALMVLSGSVISQNGEKQAVDVHKRNNYFYVAPAELFFNTLQLGYERKFHNHNTLALNGGFKLSKKDEIINRIGGTGEIQYRINLFYNKEAITRLTENYTTFAYFAPYIQYRYEEINDPVTIDFTSTVNNTTWVNSVFGGLGFGFRFTALENRFCLNVFAGGGLKYSDVTGNKKYTEFFESGYTGFAPKLALQIGIAF